MDIPETHYAKTPDGYHIAYQTLGDGPIDLLHFGGAYFSIDSMWDEPSASAFLRRQASARRVILFDKRGQGLSDALPLGEEPSLEWWVDDACAVLDATGSQRAAIHGTSNAGAAAILLAASRPSRVSALILDDAWARLAAADDMPWGRSAEQQASHERAIAKDWARFVARSYPDRPSGNRFNAWARRAMLRGSSPAQALAKWRLDYGVDVRDVLASVSVPTLVLHGEDGPYFPNSKHGAYLAAHIPGATRFEFPAAWSYSKRSGALEEIETFLTGSRPPPRINRVFATVLFTDIVSSTPRTAELGDARWRDLLDRHDRVVQGELERFRGTLIKSTGDGTLATFDGPARAVSCAQAIGEGLGALGLEVRAGLHAGEVEMRGEDIAGLAVNIARRVCDAAGSGEVLVSRTVTDLVVGSGLEFDDRGEHELKGLPGTWAIYAVRS